jgi:hypothetical protein
VGRLNQIKQMTVIRMPLNMYLVVSFIS